MVNIESKTIGTRITTAMYTKILELLAINTHVSISDYLRDLIRRDLENRSCFDNERREQS